jgi:hypothetical protein
MSNTADQDLVVAREEFLAAIRRYGALGTKEARDAWVAATERLAEVEARCDAVMVTAVARG